MVFMSDLRHGFVARLVGAATLGIVAFVPVNLPAFSDESDEAVYRKFLAETRRCLAFGYVLENLYSNDKLDIIAMDAGEDHIVNRKKIFDSAIGRYATAQTWAIQNKNELAMKIFRDDAIKLEKDAFQRLLNSVYKGGPQRNRVIVINLYEKCEIINTDLLINVTNRIKKK